MLQATAALCEGTLGPFTNMPSEHGLRVNIRGSRAHGRRGLIARRSIGGWLVDGGTAGVRRLDVAHGRLGECVDTGLRAGVDEKGHDVVSGDVE